jgi:hypothetical protein
MRLKLQVVKQGRKSKYGPAVHLMVRDEDYFLPFYFPHYRSIGFSEFLVYADRCSAPTMDFLSAQPDATVLTGDYTFGQTFGKQLTGHTRRLSQFLAEHLDELLPEKWVLIADSDEFLVLPPPANEITKFINVLERVKQPYSSAPMVEMYPQCLSLRNHEAKLSPFEVSIFFDVGPYFDWQPMALSPEVYRRGIWHRLLQILVERYPAEIINIYGSRNVGPPSIYKVPLLKHGCGIRRIGNHKITAYPYAQNMSALLHFKFSPCLDQKIATAVAEGQYFNGSVAYKTLALATEKLPFETLVGAPSRRFTGPDSLVSAKLLSPHI